MRNRNELLTIPHTYQQSWKIYQTSHIFEVNMISNNPYNDLTNRHINLKIQFTCEQQICTWFLQDLLFVSYDEI